jgi:hypothetical protein
LALHAYPVYCFNSGLPDRQGESRASLDRF